MSTTAASTEAKPRTLAPNEIPFTDGPLPFRNYTSDTGKILPRKWTHLPAKQQRAVTKTIKQARNNLMAL
jgi:small subunit ribosomal protein S18